MAGTDQWLVTGGHRSRAVGGYSSEGRGSPPLGVHSFHTAGTMSGTGDVPDPDADVAVENVDFLDVVLTYVDNVAESDIAVDLVAAAAAVLRTVAADAATPEACQTAADCGRSLAAGSDAVVVDVDVVVVVLPGGNAAADDPDDVDSGNSAALLLVDLARAADDIPLGVAVVELPLYRVDVVAADAVAAVLAGDAVLVAVAVDVAVAAAVGVAVVLPVVVLADVPDVVDAAVVAVVLVVDVAAVLVGAAVVAVVLVVAVAAVLVVLAAAVLAAAFGTLAGTLKMVLESQIPCGCRAPLVDPLYCWGYL